MKNYLSFVDDQYLPNDWYTSSGEVGYAACNTGEVGNRYLVGGHPDIYSAAIDKLKNSGKKLVSLPDDKRLEFEPYEGIISSESFNKITINFTSREV